MRCIVGAHVGQHSNRRLFKSHFIVQPCMFANCNFSVTFGFYDGASYFIIMFAGVLVRTLVSTTIIGYVILISLLFHFSSPTVMFCLPLYSVTVLLF